MRLLNFFGLEEKFVNSDAMRFKGIHRRITRVSNSHSAEQSVIL